MRALITGITGQDGSYLAEQLVADGHQVCGLVRGQANPKRAWIQSLVPAATLLDGDLLDGSSLRAALEEAKPDVVFNLGAVTYVGLSWQQPTLMTEVTGLGVLRLLEAIRQVDPQIRLVQASSSEMFGQALESPQRETTPFHPRSPYGVAKCFAHHTTVNYRESYGLHASTAIMFNHESPRRGEEFVTRKITMAVVRMARGEQQQLRLGNISTYRDWGWAPDFMRALPRIAAQDTPGDYVLATGETHSVKELVGAAMAEAGMVDWRRVAICSDLHRPADVAVLHGDPGKAARVLGWEPQVRFGEIVRRLVAHDLDLVAA